MFNAIAPEKDLDCVNPANIGHVLLGDQLFAPATPSACIEILDREGIELQGLDVTIVNHSNIVGKPVALLCLNRNASVHVVHVFSKDVPAACREADVLICADCVPFALADFHSRLLEGRGGLRRAPLLQRYEQRRQPREHPGDRRVEPAHLLHLLQRPSPDDISRPGRSVPHPGHS